MIQIGSYTLDTKVLLAPLSGVSDLAYRLVAREHGARFCFHEMVDAHSLNYEQARKTVAILRTDPRDTPIAAQLLGDDPALMLKAARKLLVIARGASFLDVNAACPAKKVVKKGAGSRLLTRPGVLYTIIGTLADALPVPVTVKLRTGYEKTDIPAIAKIAKGCENAGAAAIFVHGRTREQGYAGEVDYDAIHAVKNAVTVPVIASGNILSGPLAKKMFDRTSCDGILVARGSMGNPWIFEDIRRYLETGSVPPPVDMATKKRVLARHLSYIEEYKDLTAYGKVGYMRKFVMWYLKGVRNATRVREHICAVRTYTEMLSLVNALEEDKEETACVADV